MRSRIAAVGTPCRHQHQIERTGDHAPAPDPHESDQRENGEREVAGLPVDNDSWRQRDRYAVLENVCQEQERGRPQPAHPGWCGEDHRREQERVGTGRGGVDQRQLTHPPPRLGDQWLAPHGSSPRWRRCDPLERQHARRPARWRAVEVRCRRQRRLPHRALDPRPKPADQQERDDDRNRQREKRREHEVGEPAPDQKIDAKLAHHKSTAAKKTDWLEPALPFGAESTRSGRSQPGPVRCGRPRRWARAQRLATCELVHTQAAKQTIDWASATKETAEASWTWLRWARMADANLSGREA